jgi:hypothetical protein
MATAHGETDSRALEVDRETPFDGLTIVRESLPSAQPGSLLLVVERFSLAANNLSYVLVNDVLRTLPSPRGEYWRRRHPCTLPVVDSGPAAVDVHTGDREVDLVRERGWQAVQSLYEDLRADLIPWASRWLQVTTVSGLGAAPPVWRGIVAGQSDPLSAVVIRP